MRIKNPPTGYTGAFLVRASESHPGTFAISFRAERKLKHCQIRRVWLFVHLLVSTTLIPREQSGRNFCIGETMFDSLVKLVEYYEKTPLYRKMKLRFG